jgi:hypothetical protein
MLSLEACRQILGGAAPTSDEELEELRDRMRKLGGVLLGMAKDNREQRKKVRQVSS